jgi:hypothetical protein
MAKSSLNLSDRIFFTIDRNDGSGYFGELAREQKRILNLTPEELKRLAKFIKMMVGE